VADYKEYEKPVFQSRGMLLHVDFYEIDMSNLIVQAALKDS